MNTKNLARLALFLLAAPALAAEHESAGGPFSGDLGNALWTLVIFGLVVFVLGKFAWRPLLAGLKAREDFIHDSLAAAKRDREAAEARLAEYEQKLVAARAEATALVEEARRDAEVVRHRIQEETQAEARQTVERARREVALATDAAKKELHTYAGGLAVEIAGKVLGREVRPADHERLIAEAITAIERSDN